MAGGDPFRAHQREVEDEVQLIVAIAHISDIVIFCNQHTIVLIARAGLYVCDPRLLRDAMARLSRLSTAVVWLNPLLETPGYEPTALGMTAARPYVTTFMSVKDPADLARLARVMRIK